MRIYTINRTDPTEVLSNESAPSKRTKKAILNLDSGWLFYKDNNLCCPINILSLIYVQIKILQELYRHSQLENNCSFKIISKHSYLSVVLLLSTSLLLYLQQKEQLLLEYFQQDERFLQLQHAIAQ